LKKAIKPIYIRERTKMSEKKLFSDKRWHDIPNGKTVGHIEFTEEEKEKNRKESLEILKKMGVNIDELKEF